MKLRYVVALAWASLLAGSGCCARREAPVADVVTLTTSKSDLQASALTNFLAQGDFGIALAGEHLYVLETGRLYRIERDGRASPAKPDGAPAAGSITRFQTDRSYDVGDMNRAQFTRTLDWKRPAPDRVYAIRITGAFRGVVLENGEPLPDGAGALFGFYYPDGLQCLRESGYDLVYLNGDRSRGGRAKSFVIQQGRIDLDECDTLAIHLPQP